VERGVLLGSRHSNNENDTASTVFRIVSTIKTTVN